MTNMKTLLTLIIGFGLALTSFGGSTNQTTSADLLLSRTYKVSVDTFMSHLKHLLPPGPGESDTELLIHFFKQKHIKIKPPKSVFLDEKLNLLFVHATQADQDKIEKFVEEIASGK